MDQDLASRPGSQGAGEAGGGSAKGPSHLLPGKAGCHCPGGQPGLSVQCRRAGPHGLGGNRGLAPPGQGNQNRFAAQPGLGGHPGPADRGHSPGGPGAKVWDVGVPVGVIAAIVPSTNPTSTVCYKAMIALKAGCSIVFSPHPAAAKCTQRAVEIVARPQKGPAAPGAQWVACKLPPWRL